VNFENFVKNNQIVHLKVGMLDGKGILDMITPIWNAIMGKIMNTLAQYQRFTTIF